MRFVDYLTMLGWTFDTNEDYAWVVRILHDSERSELQRIADIDMILFGGPLENPLNG